VEALFELQQRSYARAGPAVLGSWPPESALGKEELAQYLGRRDYCVLATVTRGARPQARPVAFVILNGALWFATGGGARLSNLRRNPYVSVVIAEGDAGTHVLVLAEGAVTVHDKAPTVVEAWERRHGSKPNWAAAFLELRPERLFSYSAS
jgi:nitroimidazol reductase NimA-like FMN-containing flavoprotein (pyridoxamine 5'-phosphate oxidase superfamily)